jgi:hypothetical protein
MTLGIMALNTMTPSNEMKTQDFIMTVSVVPCQTIDINGIQHNNTKHYNI